VHRVVVCPLPFERLESAFAVRAISHKVALLMISDDLERECKAGTMVHPWFSGIAADDERESGNLHAVQKDGVVLPLHPNLELVPLARRIDRQSVRVYRSGQIVDRPGLRACSKSFQ
jgi:hypothetical protein